MSEYKRIDNEKFNEYLLRIGNEYKKLGWNILSEVFNDMSNNNYSSDSWRKWYNKEVNSDYKYNKINPDIDFAKNDISSDKEKINELENQLTDYNKLKRDLDQLKKERIKFSEDKKEYNRWLREEARDDLITERICNAIKETEPLKFPHKEIKRNNTGKEHVLIISDAHYGCEFEIKGLYGDILNSYSPEIFKERMNYLLHRVIEYVVENDISSLHVFDLGDSTDGMLRVGQIWKLRYGVVESAIQYANYISNWLNELSHYTNIRFQMTNGNHTELRQLGQPKGTFIQDNMGSVIKEFIKVKLEGNKNFTFVDNPTGYVYAQVACSTVLGIHGEVKNMEKAVKDLSRIYSVHIDYLLAGHLHHSKSDEIGVRSEVINVPSIIGMDDYSLSIMKCANAGAKILTFDQNDGLINDYRIKLN